MHSDSDSNENADASLAIAAPETKVSPMMAQWHQCKKMAKDAVLLFRMGDFYEAFYEDAIFLAKELGLTLTKRQDIPMCGVPWHTSESYVDKLVSRGHRVAIAEQMEDPKQAKGLVKRDVARIVTPGTVVNSSLISDKANNFFASVAQVGAIFGLAYLDLTTAEFRVIEIQSPRDLINELFRVRPSEILVANKFKEKHSTLFSELHRMHNFLLTTEDDWHFDHQIAYDYLVGQLKVQTLDGFGLRGMVAGINAAGALLSYIQETLSLNVDHIGAISTYATSQYMLLDHTTQRNLELTHSLQDGSRKNTLIGILDRTCTPMGGRLFQQWLKQPLLDVEAIRGRQESVESLLSAPEAIAQTKQLLEHVRDLERLIMKISTGYANPRDVVALRFSLQAVPAIKQRLSTFAAPLLRGEVSKLVDMESVTRLIAEALVDEPALRLGEGIVFRKGFNATLDELRDISSDSKAWMANYQIKLREQTGIKTLKVSYSKILGYYIEVSKGQTANMPDSFMRKQTLVNAERYCTPELKEYEGKVLSAEEKVASLENELFSQLRTQLSAYTPQVLSIATAIANIDCLNSLAEVAWQHHYVKPNVDASALLHIEGGRHPVIETVAIGEKFIPNDTIMDNHENRLFIITGPNMAGKSTYIRQVALLTIMAQMGSFIPAKKAHIGIVDKVFTRVGASDDISRGHSTFMVEMVETANILHNATTRSLVILDEIGRGTSTYDGISIAWSIAEYLLTTPEKAAKTLFATHYWELTKLEEKIPGAVNYHIAVKEHDDQVIFLRKIVRGDTDKSYGIHVGKLAGLPQSVLMRAKEILLHLEENANRKSTFEPAPSKKICGTRIKSNSQEVQLMLFEPPKSSMAKKYDAIITKLQSIDLNQLTPLQAHMKLEELKNLAK